MKKNITIYDIAAETGVSPATVSRILTGNAGVSPEKRKIVEESIAKHNFRPNAIAKGLSDTRTGVLGVMAADIRNPYYASLVVECEKAASKRGYTVILCNALSDQQLENANLEKFYDQRVEAIIQIGASVDDLTSKPAYVEKVNRIALNIPFVISGILTGADCHTVCIDNVEAMKVVFEYLVSLGHQKIAMIGGSTRVRSTYEKHQQYSYLIGKYNLIFQQEFLQLGDYSVDCGYECMVKLLALREYPTAIIAINDLAAIGAFRAILESGLSVPNDISLVGFDNTFLCETIRPSLTSVDYNYVEFGETLVSIAIQAIRKEDCPRNVLIKPRLVVRDSCARLPLSASGK
jgi:DNA-binding LacI/PurR family transcriptional regulator